jgi:hypothetical protein
MVRFSLLNTVRAVRVSIQVSTNTLLITEYLYRILILFFSGENAVKCSRRLVFVHSYRTVHS